MTPALIFSAMTSDAVIFRYTFESRGPNPGEMVRFLLAELGMSVPLCSWIVCTVQRVSGNQKSKNELLEAQKVCRMLD